MQVNIGVLGDQAHDDLAEPGDDPQGAGRWRAHRGAVLGMGPVGVLCGAGLFRPRYGVSSDGKRLTAR
jgi:hypothetical protein